MKILKLFLLGILVLLAFSMTSCNTSKNSASTSSLDESKGKTTSDASIDGEEETNYRTLADYLRRIPGVQVSGSGNGVDIRIRGVSSINGSSLPLFVVDGVQSGTSYAQVASFISPHDIDNVRVLKGTAATSRYGVQGSSGVIMIKTKL